MTDRSVSTVTRTLTISDLTPVEMASIFSRWNDDDQAAFFDALHAEAASWPIAGGWQIQGYALCTKLSDQGRSVLADLADAYISSVTPS